MKKITTYLHLLFLIYFISCKGQKESVVNSGVVIFKTLFFDSVTKNYQYYPTYWANHKVWYKDSLVIAETVSLYGVLENNRYTKTDYYTFINLRTREFYRYRNFSDTAYILKKFIGPDSLGIDGSWNFFQPHGKYFLVDSVKLKDTAIDGINYRRAFTYSLINSTDSLDKSYSIIYLDCDKKELLMQFDRDMGNKLGCPIVRIDVLPLLPGALSGQLEFVSDKLTPEEKKVFDTWEKYAKTHPIK